MPKSFQLFSFSKSTFATLLTLSLTFAVGGAAAQASSAGILPVASADASFLPSMKAAPQAIGIPPHEFVQKKQAQAQADRGPAGNSVFLDAAQEETAAAPGDGEHQGIKIHGHWNINILNPDGTLVEHRDFENALQYDGQQLLLGLLSGYAVAGDYEIYFTAPPGQTSPCTSRQFPFCAIVHSTMTQPGSFACTVYTCVGGLTETYTFGTGPSMVLAGQITSQNNAQIGVVGTGYNACGSNSALSTSTVAACVAATANGGFGGTMTYASIPAVSVVPGQIIQISVTLTFS